jgi:hypothetical protein
MDRREMKNPKVDMEVTHYGMRGVIEVLQGNHAVVRFPSSGFPFPDRSIVRISELKRFRPVKKEVNAEPAPF